MSWHDILTKLQLGGVTKTLATNCSLEGYGDESISLLLNEKHASLLDEAHERRISLALTELTGKVFDVNIKIGIIKDETPAEVSARRLREIHAEAEEVMQNDEVIQTLIQDFDGKLDRDSIKPNRLGDL